MAKAALMFVPSAVAAGLCYWQLHRRQWKEERVEEARVAMAGPPLDVFTAAELPRFRRAAAEGRYDHARAVFVGPRPLSFELSRGELRDPGVQAMLSEPGAIKGGYLLLTPLTHEATGRTVMVNRGWVPAAWRARWAEQYAALQPAGRVAVTGAAQPSEEPSGFVPPNDPARGSFFWLDAPGIAEACGLHPATPLLQVLADPSTGAKGEAPSARPPAAPFPLAKKSDAVVRFSTMPEDHLGYAATWGLMAASTAYLAAKAVRRGRGGGGGSGMRVATAAGRQQQRQ